MPRRRNDAAADLSAATETIVADARAAVAAGREPELDVLRARLRTAAEAAREAAAPGAIDRIEQAALRQLERVANVQRARTRLASRPAPPATAPRASARRPVLRTRPTINANMELRRERDGETFRLVWDAAPVVVDWEVRLSERPDARADYVVRDTLSLPADATSVDLRLGDVPLRVHVLGRSRDGRLLRRAVVSSLTRTSWDERWERRASAS